MDGTAKGQLYVDDGESLVQNATSMVNFTYSAEGMFEMKGEWGYDMGEVVVDGVLVLGMQGEPGNVTMEGGEGVVERSYDEGTQVLSMNVSIPLTGDVSMMIGG